MHSLSIFSNFPLHIDLTTEKPCELYVDNLPTTNRDAIKVLWVIEPNEVSNFKDSVINNFGKFDLILSWDEEILDSCPNARLFPYGTTWINNFTFGKKEYAITTLVGGKKLCEGHNLRQLLPNALSEVTNIPIKIHNSVNNPFTTEFDLIPMSNNLWKNELFYSQFHIAIENIYSNNWFTEKLIDCFQTKTIPIYVGCPNISNFFDVKGMFHVNNLTELIDVCRNLTERTYDRMKKYVEYNYQISLKYSDHILRLKSEIKNFLSVDEDNVN